MNFSIQPTLENDQVILSALLENDFNALYEVASDPAIWEQHPNKDRWKLDVFRNFFEGAIQSKGAFKIIDKANDKIAGGTRIYDFNEKDNSVFIGYTFIGREYWGKGINYSVKALMLDYLFKFISQVDFHIGANNIRSQKSIIRTGAIKVGEQEIAYYGELPKLNFVYRIKKNEWFFHIATTA